MTLDVLKKRRDSAEAVSHNVEKINKALQDIVEARGDLVGLDTVFDTIKTDSNFLETKTLANAAVTAIDARITNLTQISL